MFSTHRTSNGAMSARQPIKNYEAKFLCLNVPRFKRQVFKHDQILSERSKRMKEQEKNKSSVLFAESAFNSQNAQFGLLMIKTKNLFRNISSVLTDFTLAISKSYQTGKCNFFRLTTILTKLFDVFMMLLFF